MSRQATDWIRQKKAEEEARAQDEMVQRHIALDAAHLISVKGPMLWEELVQECSGQVEGIKTLKNVTASLDVQVASETSQRMLIIRLSRLVHLIPRLTGVNVFYQDGEGHFRCHWHLKQEETRLNFVRDDRGELCLMRGMKHFTPASAAEWLFQQLAAEVGI